MPTIITAALADSINPCAFSVLVLTITFLFSLGKSRSYVLKIGLVYILGIYLSYLAIGLGMLQVLSVLGVPRFMSKIGAIILLAWGGLNLADLFIPDFPIKLKIPDSLHAKIATLIHKAAAWPAFILGVLVGLSEFPCTGGPYLLILGMLHDQARFWQGFWYLILYNLIFVSPLVAILWFSSDPKLHDKVNAWRKSHGRQFEIISSIILVLMGLFILYVK